MSGVVKTIPLKYPQTMPVRELPPVLVGPEAPATLPGGQPGEAERTAEVAPEDEVDKKPRRPWYRDGAMALIPLLLIAGFCGYNAVTQPTLSLSPGTAHWGDQVVVTATNVPANQVGDIQIRGTAYSFPFSSSKNGDVRETLVIPRDIPAGNVGVRICWRGSCHAEAILRVIAAAPVAVATPSAAPSASPSPSPSASPSSNTAPAGGPAPAPSSAPQPQPSTAPAPSPPAPSASISLSSKTIVIITGSVTVYGRNFGAGKVITITFAEGAFTRQFSATAASDGSFSKLISPQAVTPGQATITACDSNACASQVITVTAT